MQYHTHTFKTTTGGVIMKPNATERLLQKREKLFANSDKMSPEEIKIVSLIWHKKMNRYQSFTAKILIRQFQKWN